MLAQGELAASLRLGGQSWRVKTPRMPGRGGHSVNQNKRRGAFGLSHHVLEFAVSRWIRLFEL